MTDSVPSQNSAAADNLSENSLLRAENSHCPLSSRTLLVRILNTLRNFVLNVLGFNTTLISILTWCLRSREPRYKPVCLDCHNMKRFLKGRRNTHNCQDANSHMSSDNITGVAYNPKPPSEPLSVYLQRNNELNSKLAQGDQTLNGFKSDCEVKIETFTSLNHELAEVIKVSNEVSFHEPPNVEQEHQKEKASKKTTAAKIAKTIESFVAKEIGKNSAFNKNKTTKIPVTYNVSCVHDSTETILAQDSSSTTVTENPESLDANISNSTSKLTSKKYSIKSQFLKVVKNYRDRNGKNAKQVQDSSNTKEMGPDKTADVKETELPASNVFIPVKEQTWELQSSSCQKQQTSSYVSEAQFNNIAYAPSVVDVSQISTTPDTATRELSELHERNITKRKKKTRPPKPEETKMGHNTYKPIVSDTSESVGFDVSKLHDSSDTGIRIKTNAQNNQVKHNYSPVSPAKHNDTTNNVQDSVNIYEGTETSRAQVPQTYACNPSGDAIKSGGAVCESGVDPMQTATASGVSIDSPHDFNQSNVAGAYSNGVLNTMLRQTANKANVNNIRRNNVANSPKTENQFINMDIDSIFDCMEKTPPDCMLSHCEKICNEYDTMNPEFRHNVLRLFLTRLHQYLAVQKFTPHIRDNKSKVETRAMVKLEQMTVAVIKKVYKIKNSVQPWLQYKIEIINELNAQLKQDYNEYLTRKRTKAAKSKEGYVDVTQTSAQLSDITREKDTKTRKDNQEEVNVSKEDANSFVETHEAGMFENKEPESACQLKDEKQNTPDKNKKQRKGWRKVRQPKESKRSKRKKREQNEAYTQQEMDADEDEGQVSRDADGKDDRLTDNEADANEDALIQGTILSCYCFLF